MMWKIISLSIDSGYKLGMFSNYKVWEPNWKKASFRISSWSVVFTFLPFRPQFRCWTDWIQNECVFFFLVLTHPKLNTSKNCSNQLDRLHWLTWNLFHLKDKLVFIVYFSILVNFRYRPRNEMDNFCWVLREKMPCWFMRLR